MSTIHLWQFIVITLPGWINGDLGDVSVELEGVPPPGVSSVPSCQARLTSSVPGPR